jgi:hypothetical protein
MQIQDQEDGVTESEEQDVHQRNMDPETVDEDDPMDNVEDGEEREVAMLGVAYHVSSAKYQGEPHVIVGSLSGAEYHYIKLEPGSTIRKFSQVL